MILEEEIPQHEIKDYLDFTRETLAEARRIILQMMQEKFTHTTKADTSFVTEVDLAVEQMIRERVQAKYPHHGVLGEELPTINADADFLWVTDPVDGTQNLVHQLPTFGCILGLHYRGRPLVGGIDHPKLDLCYLAGKGCGAWENGKQLRIVDSDSSALDVNEIIALATRAMFDRSGEAQLFDAFIKTHPAIRIFYDCFSTTRAVAGQVGALVEFNVRLWDLAASEILITEAGGVYQQVRMIPQPDGKEPLRSVIMGKKSVVEAILPYFTSK